MGRNDDRSVPGATPTAPLRQCVGVAVSVSFRDTTAAIETIVAFDADRSSRTTTSRPCVRVVWGVLTARRPSLAITGIILGPASNSTV